MLTGNPLIFIDSTYVFLSFLIVLGAEMGRKYTYGDGGLSGSIDGLLTYGKYCFLVVVRIFNCFMPVILNKLYFSIN
tara:strand:- start:448 stop:678 length:231 start_codon:yes stop_codon:yes gene_type:complete